jgi:hypothetical protein
MNSSLKTILSLYDYSGNWSQPYRDAGYHVIQVDKLLNGADVRLLPKMQTNIYGILAACPCTAFSRAGMWKPRSESEMMDAISLVDCVFRYVWLYKPKFFAIENPPGRMMQFLGKPNFKFQPFQFGAGHSKLTYLWGKFNNPKPTIHTLNQSPDTGYITRLGSKGKIARSTTPIEFAQAFYEVNK